MKLQSFILSLLFAVLFSSCMNTIVLDSKKYPVSDRTVFVYNFENSAFQADVNGEMTEVLRNHIYRRKNFFPQKKPSDSVFSIYGEITMYRKEGRMYDNYRDPVRFELMVGVRVKMRSTADSLLLLDSEFVASTDYSEKEGFIESEFRARQRVLRKLAIQISNSMETAFLSVHHE